MNPQPSTTEEIVVSRVNRLGTATEALFSRLYRGLNRKARQQTSPVIDQSEELQRRLKASNLEVDRLNSILASIGEGVIMQDLEGRIVLVNAAARRLLGSQKAFWQSELGKLFNDYNDLLTMDTEMALLGEPTRVEVNHRVIGAQLAAVADSEGNRLGTVIVLRDVTAEALSERLKDQFITAISHELRTPMAVIKGMSEVMLGQPTDAKPNRRLLETLSRNVDILDRMIVELLDLSELSSGNFKIRNIPLQLEDLVWNVVKGMQPEAKQAELDIAVMVRDADSLHINGDDARLRWALGHLLQNAIRYTENKGHIIITLRRVDSMAAVQIVDTGVGISDRDLPHIFDRFYRGEARTPSGRLLDPRGLGQGLFVARAVSEAHGGYLTVSSTPGSGSIFTLFLPATH
jgi:signal transduction histidine kinase